MLNGNSKGIVNERFSIHDLQTVQKLLTMLYPYTQTHVRSLKMSRKPIKVDEFAAARKLVKDVFEFDHFACLLHGHLLTGKSVSPLSIPIQFIS